MQLCREVTRALTGARLPRCDRAKRAVGQPRAHGDSRDWPSRLTPMGWSRSKHCSQIVVFPANKHPPLVPRHLVAPACLIGAGEGSGTPRRMPPWVLARSQAPIRISSRGPGSPIGCCIEDALQHCLATQHACNLMASYPAGMLCHPLLPLANANTDMPRPAT
ncbi:uncharacterized protein B0I36DRAFT_336062 [Microdochium trichocladiopsis]|uniref:Uncharacterized protein n=1 Tax=Microdochium trichocladiopsis TaxID=1682393 RepID=A0A9P8XV72_9PEZI|nr:uncharacterized protein B0I36DRAFT_336062 [Microdochium trichocladiopsis]KAH7018490.1 hypothetical protein B0I36DRAFT_336062 [Microdochium trichocladiopsis]